MQYSSNARKVGAVQDTAVKKRCDTSMPQQMTTRDQSRSSSLVTPQRRGDVLVSVPQGVRP
eukprot:6153214-Pleurochrysis_carterae.AAC.1